MKGERGPRSAKYLMVFEIDTARSTRSLLSGGGHASQEENDRFDEQHPETAAAWERLSEMIVDIDIDLDLDLASDDVVIAE